MQHIRDILHQLVSLRPFPLSSATGTSTRARGLAAERVERRTLLPAGANVEDVPAAELARAHKPAREPGRQRALGGDERREAQAERRDLLLHGRARCGARRGRQEARGGRQRRGGGLGGDVVGRTAPGGRGRLVRIVVRLERAQDDGDGLRDVVVDDGAPARALALERVGIVREAELFEEGALA